MIEESYPQAVVHLRSAQKCKSQMAAIWSAALNAQFMGSTVKLNEDGTGAITASVEWPSDLQNDLTQQFANCVTEIWSALDSLIVETVQLFSSSRTPRASDTDKYWPIADSKENLELLLEQACLNGVLRIHADIVRTTQPFLPDSEVEYINRIRSGLRQLLAWTEALDSGERITVWATPIDPTIETSPPSTAIECITCPAFDLGDNPDGIVATFRVPAYEPSMQVAGRPGTMLDLGFAAGFIPAGTNDTFHARLTEVLRVVSLLHAHFATGTNNVNGTRALPIRSQDRENLWRSAAESPRGWYQSELSKLAKTGARVAVVVDPDPTELVLLVSTANEIFERRIPNATKLRASDTVGIAAERAVHEAVATWGLPDFVMKPQVERKGSGVREVGDGLLIAGDVGAIVQVKGRSVEASNPEKEARWINKNVEKAIKQVQGTYRRLQQSPIDLENGRGRLIQVDGSAVTWVGVVIIDHPQIPEQHPLSSVGVPVPAIVLTRRDWEFLFEQLKSTSAVIQYLIRVGSSSKYLGEEPHRYFDLASLDADAVPKNSDSSVKVLGTVFSHPMLPMEPAGAGHPVEFGLTRIICEDIAGIDSDQSTVERQAQIFAAIDALPVTARVELGTLLHDELKREPESEGFRWRARTFLPPAPGGRQVSFIVCSAYNELTTDALKAWLMLRHSERKQTEDIATAQSIAVLLTPRADYVRPWDTTLLVVEGDLQLSGEEMASYLAIWGKRGEHGNTII
ncbi:hypothetical protein CQ018_10430 [Arthrobacter sp. MYb227]|uniref:hypothetical protein n=1 Tax=Arthrobacter sp. MYb227 TaxID=1848601 RepID=UPI000CFBD501|nr:hypothetical protein [Arthrobacter sp. MYb227]PQZ92887.1 hypothetical protein CQ018_10430 [Arthrobacter sp. MYb227]